MGIKDLIHTSLNRRGSVLSTVVLILLVTILAGGGIYVWQRGEYDVKEMAYVEELQMLNNKIKALELDKSAAVSALDVLTEKYKVLESTNGKIEWDFLQLSEKHAAILKEFEPLKATKLSVEEEKKKTANDLESLKKALREYETDVVKFKEQIEVLKTMHGSEMEVQKKVEATLRAQIAANIPQSGAFDVLSVSVSSEVETQTEFPATETITSIE